ncbi:DUF3558 domain-containing protein [Nocardia uniformis]|uniref:DUF3558 domain-containing protein n=1 Tax=Nocardia uniformis TaxID=53432 RepID=A0A849C364_9NOCA|nr:DUF3558 domain-containing protein [Nocardia uniformis]NNH72188.1 DUF3558 domain-containing protein [Nocardia uniformis]
MRGFGLFVVSACALAVSACGTTADSRPSADVPSGPVRVAELGTFVGECGYVSDDEIHSVTGLSDPTMVFRNSVTCRWFYTGIETDVTFASYRGSPIDRERAWEVLWGRELESVEIAGHSGFLSYSPDGDAHEVCVLAVGLGDDFFEWAYRGIGTQRASCAMIQRFAELTVQRLG